MYKYVKQGAVDTRIDKVEDRLFVACLIVMVIILSNAPSHRC
jgi:hypothetical protein